MHMELQKLEKEYQTEANPEKRLQLLKRILVLAVESNDPKLVQWLQELIKLNPTLQEPANLLRCPKCDLILKKKKTVDIYPRAQIEYYTCPQCYFLRIWIYPSIYSKKVLVLEDTDVTENLDRLKNLIDEMKKIEETERIFDLLVKTSKSSDAQIRAFSHQKLGEIYLEMNKIDQALEQLQLALNIYNRDKSHYLPEVTAVLQKLIYLNLSQDAAAKALPLIDELEQISDKIDDKRMFVGCKINRGVALESLKEYETAMEFYTEAMNLAEENDFSDLFDEASEHAQLLLEKVESEESE